MTQGKHSMMLSRINLNKKNCFSEISGFFITKGNVTYIYSQIKEIHNIKTHIYIYV